jgi:hypothetical protein
MDTTFASGVNQNHFHETFHGEQKVTPQFTSPQEELEFLRAELAKKEAALSGSGIETKRENLATNLIENYKSTPIEQVVHPSLQMTSQEQEGIALNLKPEKHDQIMEELVTILMEKGIRNALETVRNMNSPHLDDDFERFLVQYLASYHTIPGLVTDTETYKNLDTALFEITLPAPEPGKTYKDSITLMEQFYATMQAVGPGKNEKNNYFSLEIALSNDSEQVIFYVGVPTAISDLFQKQALGLFHNAHIKPITNDYNIFFEGGYAAGSFAVPSNTDIMTIKTYDQFDHDPLELLLGVFDKIKKTGEGASVQVIVKPVGDKYTAQYGKLLDRLRKGESLKSIKESLNQDLGAELKKFGKALWSIAAPAKSEKKDDDKKVDDIAIQHVTKKLQSTIVETTIRIITSAESQARAEELLRDLESAFFQYNEVQSNGIEFKHPKGDDLRLMFRDFSYRRFDTDRPFHLNFKELSTMFHFPTHASGSTQLKQAGAATHPAPIEMGTNGIMLGINEHRGSHKEIHFSPIDRLRHFYTIGQTGVGKTQIFLKMIVQDIKNGDGCCYIDPHGTDINTILANIPPERFDDVIYFDPSYLARPMALNMLEFDERFPQQKSLVIGELMSLFDKLFDMKAQGGAMFGQYFRNSALLNMEDPASGNTVLEITRVLANKQFRDYKLSKNKNPIIAEFWKSAEQTSGDQGLENFVPYISSKFDDFISNEFLRPIILQEKSAFNFREIIDNKKILIVNLSKGLIGEKNGNLLGLILIMKLQMAAMSRAEAVDLSQFPPFYVYLDEFQNVVTESIAAILSEARKYKLSLNMTHQYLEQLPDFIKSAIFGNVGNMAFFRINSADAAVIEPRITPRFTKDDVIKQENFNCIVSMLVEGKPAAAFNMNTFEPDGYFGPHSGNPGQIEQLKQLSYMKYGRDRAEIEAEIANKFKMI